jgi:hypothetical protein
MRHLAELPEVFAKQVITMKKGRKVKKTRRYSPFPLMKTGRYRSTN